MTVNNPDTGDKLVIITATSSAPGSACPVGTTASPVPQHRAGADPGADHRQDRRHRHPVPGGSSAPTRSRSPTPARPPTPASASPTRCPGCWTTPPTTATPPPPRARVSYASPVLTWTGNLAPGGVRGHHVSPSPSNNPDTGDRILANTWSPPPPPGSNCPAGGTDPRCTATVPVVSAALLTITITAGAPSAVAGGVVHYTITIANSGADAVHRRGLHRHAVRGAGRRGL